MKKKRMIQAAAVLALCLALAGCRARIYVSGEAKPAGQGETAAETERTGAGEETDRDKQEKNEETGGKTKENPDASRKEYDENRPAEIMPGAEKTVHGEEAGGGFSGAGEDAEKRAAKLNGEAEETAKRTTAAEEAEQKGVDEEAEEADSAMTYYTVLLNERTGDLFECQRINVYWETKEDHRTIFRTSPEHELILKAGAYDVSARLLESNLRVDDGWIGRKNPGMVVKVTDRSVLGTGVLSTEAARNVYRELAARDGWAGMDAARNGRVLLISEELLEAPHLRLAAALMIAKGANPEQYGDVRIDDALAALGEEATGSAPSGIFYFQ